MVRQIRLANDEGHRHQKLKLEPGRLLGPVARFYAPRHLITGGIEPDDRVHLHKRQYNQSLLPIRLDGTNALHFDRYRRDACTPCASGLPSFHPCTDCPRGEKRVSIFAR